MDMKKLLAVSLTIMILGTLGGCGKQDTQEPPKVKIDYGNSELYTQEDMDAAIQVIEAEFATWEGCELHSLAYGGDAACSDENIEWLNGLEMKEQTEPFTQCILFSSACHILNTTCSCKSFIALCACNFDFLTLFLVFI